MAPSLMPLHESLAVLLLCSAWLIVKMMVVGHLTGYRRMQHKHYLNPEDAQSFSQMDTIQAQEHPVVERGLRAHRNDLESTLPFLAVGYLFLLTGPAPWLACTLLLAFTVLRTLFSVFYFKSLQPWRSLSFMLAELCLLVMLGYMAVWAVQVLL